MGDNLKAASRFVSRSISSLDNLMTTDKVDPSYVINELADLQRGAKTMRARAIYRAAQTAVDMLHKGRPADHVQSELRVVRSLVEQYNSGLIEVTHAMNYKHPSGETPKASPVNDMIADLHAQLAVNIAAPQGTSKSVVEVGVEAEPSMPSVDVQDSPHMQDHTPSFSGAISHLEPLIAYAPEARQRAALHRLSQIHGAQNARAAVTPKVPRRGLETVEFEALMPEVTNVVLTTARHMGKTVSISYAANGVRIGPAMAETLRPALIDLCSLLVSHSLETPQVRRERGQSGAGHVSLIARLNQGKIMITAECTGRDIDKPDLNSSHWKTLYDAGVQIKLGREDNRFCLNITDIPTYLHGRKDQNLSDHMNSLEQAS